MSWDGVGPQPWALLLPEKRKRLGKESACNAGDPGSIPRSGRCAGEGIDYPFQYSWAYLVAQLIKNLPAMQETWVQSRGQEDPLEKGMATHSSLFLPGEFHGQRSLVCCSPWGHRESDTTEQLTCSSHLFGYL